eukprot:2817256-Amphidinium_carterae.2
MDFGDFGIYTAGHKGHRYFLAMIFRTFDSERNALVLAWFQPTNDRSNLSVQTRVCRLLALLPTLKPLQGAGIDTTVKRIHCDRATEFGALQPLADHLCIHLSTSPSYMPQSNGLAERMVRLCKRPVRKLVGASQSIDHSLWPYACLWTGELMRHAAIN